MKKFRLHSVALATMASVSLAACFGGGDDDPVAVDNSVPPASASASSQGFLDYIAGIPALMIDGAEPVDLSAFSPPTENDDTKEPARTSIDA